MQVETKELAIVKAQITKAQAAANALEIKTKDDLTGATDLLSKIKTIGKLIKDKKEVITKPINTALKEVRGLFNPIEEAYENAETTIKTKLLIYQKEVNEQARIEEAKIAARVEKGTMRFDTGAKKIEAIEKVDITTKGKIGEIQIKKIKKIRIVDGTLIPREYMVPDLVAIKQAAINEGRIISGVEVYEEEIVAAR